MERFQERPELIFALVGAAGTRLDDLAEALKRQLTVFGYHGVDIRLSDLLMNFAGLTPQSGTTDFDRITHLQNMGNAFREQLSDGAALARAAIGIDHVFEEYNGDHRNRIWGQTGRLYTQVLPYFSPLLEPQNSSRK